MRTDFPGKTQTEEGAAAAGQCSGRAAEFTSAYGLESAGRGPDSGRKQNRAIYTASVRGRPAAHRLRTLKGLCAAKPSGTFSAGEPSGRPSGVRRLVLCAVLAAVGVALNLLENMVPAFLVLPGGKLGLANVATTAALALFGPGFALAVGLCRCAVAALLSGAMTAVVYGGAGTVLSVLAMFAASKAAKGRLSLVGLSMLGAFFFNVGQVAVAAAVVSNWNIFRYLPALTLVSTVCGMLTGIIAARAVPYIKRGAMGK